MALFRDFEPARLHKQTWAEAHRFEILMAIGVAMCIFVLLIAILSVEPTVANTI